MVVSMLDGCGDQCGWIASFFAALTYGSYGVPIKETKKMDVHPLVLQVWYCSSYHWFFPNDLSILATCCWVSHTHPSFAPKSYKTLVFFLTCWFVILLGVQPRWTPWGILSGLLWVSGGTGGIYGIRNAGMALAVGTWASVMVMINFIWGILIFHEPIHNFTNTCHAFFLLGLGLVGMSRYSSVPRPTTASNIIKAGNEDIQALFSEESRQRQRNSKDTSPNDDDEFLKLLGETNEPTRKELKIPFFGGTMAMTQRQLGILGAVVNGVLSGSSLIPLHYAKKEGFGGATYMVPFACGSMIANFAFWVILFLYQFCQSGGSPTGAWEKLPSWHFRQLWAPGLCAGLLLSMGMFGSILSVTYLGQGVGNSLVQSKILISGMWGICWYKEITERPAIVKWFLSAAITVTGVLWLSYEHIKGGH